MKSIRKANTMKQSRRVFNTNIGVMVGAAVLGGFGRIAADAQQNTVKLGMSLPLTGADAEDAMKIARGFQMAIDQANAKGGIAGHKVEVVLYDSGTVMAGQYDPAQAATNAKRLVADPLVVANLGPQMSGEGKAMAPVLSEADLATITPSSTNSDITDPKMASTFKPKGKAIYFRTVTTDAFQGPNMANFFAQNLKVKTVYVLDDSGAYGVGIADSFQKQAEKDGIKVLGHDQLNSKEADYRTILTKIKGLKPDALYYGGVAQAGVKLAKQAYEIIPTIVKGGGDGIQGGSFLKGAGFPAIEGWYATSAGPHLTEDPAAAEWVKSFTDKYTEVPSDYSITAYDGALVVLDAIMRVVESGKELTEDPLLAPHIIETLKMQGVEQFGDFAIQIRLKMMTKPGEQFVVRRKALSMIKKAFDANGIQFAFPTVQVAGGTDAVGAAARQSLDMLKPAPEA